MSVINAVVFIEMQFSVWMIFTSCLCLCVCFRQWWSGYQYHRDGRRSWYGSGETGNLCQDGHRGWSCAERRQVTRPTRPLRACLCLRVSRMMTLLSVICLLSTKLSTSLMQTPVATLPVCDPRICYLHMLGIIFSHGWIHISRLKVFFVIHHKTGNWKCVVESRFGWR